MSSPGLGWVDCTCEGHKFISYAIMRYPRKIKSLLLLLLLMSLSNQHFEDAGDRTDGLWFLSERKRMSNHLQVSQERQQILLSCFLDPECWSVCGFNARPYARQSSALQHELTKRGFFFHKNSSEIYEI